MAKRYELIGADGKPYESEIPGTLGGHRRNKVYGRLDCAGALRWIAKGYYAIATLGAPAPQARMERTRTRGM